VARPSARAPGSPAERPAARPSARADGAGPNDAVNVRQLARTEKRLQNSISNLHEDAFSGIASVAALAAIPDPSPGKRNSLGIGYGNYKGENAVALGYKSDLTSNLRMTVGVAYSSNNVTSNAGLGLSW
jgi:trimeric autotransporter adhesin